MFDYRVQAVDVVVPYLRDHPSLRGCGEGRIAEYRQDRLRIGFGLYHDADDVDDLVRRLVGVPGWPA